MCNYNHYYGTFLLIIICIIILMHNINIQLCNTILVLCLLVTCINTKSHNYNGGLDKHSQLNHLHMIVWYQQLTF
jgi:hypothetical protein